MNKTKPVVSRVAAEEVLNVEERFTGYRKAVAQRLLTILQSQDTHGSQAARRAAAEREITALADLVVARRTEGES
jgi:hypothetical protein